MWASTPEQVSVPAAMTVKLYICVADAVEESVARAEKAAVPAPDGIPAIVPEAERVSPAGRAPEAIDHEYGGLPPDPASVCPYVRPVAAGGSGDAVVIVRTPAPGGVAGPVDGENNGLAARVAQAARPPFPSRTQLSGDPESK